MRRVLRTAMMALMVTVLCAAMLAPAAMAAEEPLATATIPVTVYMEGEVLPDRDDVSASIAAVTPGAPMPSEAVIDIVCRGDVSSGANAFTIDYPALGIYQYKLTIHGGAYYLGVYDEDLVYDITVSVTNNEDYSGYDVEVAARLEGGEEKCEEISDLNFYVTPMTITVLKEWVDQDSERPESIEVDLLLPVIQETLEPEETVDADAPAEGEEEEEPEIVYEVVDTIVLDEDCDWQGGWTGLDPRLGYTVKEADVPHGYTATYRWVEVEDSIDQVVIITNTGSLLQTGQLNWPIPVLAIAGLLMVGFGFWMSRRKEENA